MAAYGQLLRDDPGLGRDFDWSAVERLARNARGDDLFGLRAEFVRLVRAARDADGSEASTRRG